MKIDIYQCKGRSSKYFSVPTGTDVTKMKLPVDIDKDVLDIQLFKKDVDTKGKTAMNEDEIIRDIGLQGYAIHGAKIEVKES
jgi:hypothetical protein